MAKSLSFTPYLPSDPHTVSTSALAHSPWVCSAQRSAPMTSAPNVLSSSPIISYSHNLLSYLCADPGIKCMAVHHPSNTCFSGGADGTIRYWRMTGSSSPLDSNFKTIDLHSRNSCGHGER